MMNFKLIAIMLLVGSGLFACSAKQSVQRPAPPPVVGGYAAASTTSGEVAAAADFAIKAETQALQVPGGQPVKLELIKVVAAQQQVVAGINYRLTLKVKHNGVEKTAEAVVWHQAWRKPEPYQLTSWNWK